jgi:hypothetical protein
LQLRQDGVAVGADDTISIDYDNSVGVKPGTYTKQVWFEVFDDGSGARRIKGWYEDEGGTAIYSFFVGVNSESPGEEITDGETILFNAGNGTVVWSRVGSTLSLVSPLQLSQDGVNVGADDTISIDYDNAVGVKPGTYVKQVWFEVFDDGAGARRIKGWYEDDAGAGSYSWFAGTDEILSGEAVYWVGGTNITVTYNPGTNTFTINNTYSYAWLLAAEGTAGTASVDNGETATFRSGPGLVVTRSGNDILYEIDPVDPPWGDYEEKRRATGFIEFATGQADDYGAEPYRYGVRLHQDIVHNWNLSNMNDFHLELVDVQLDDTAALAHYRNDDTYPPGLWTTPEVSRFRNLPHWTAIDRNTIRVYATMTEEDTSMKFRYVLTEE